jgi:hypothetical protein
VTTLLRPLCKYFGSKWHATKHYPPPKYDLIVEPFAGSACYSCRYPERQIVLVDKDPDMTDLLQYLVGVSVSELRTLPTTLPKGLDIRSLPISRGAQLLIRNWQRVGRSTCWTVSKWGTGAGEFPGMWGPDTVESLCLSVPRIRHWLVVCGDYQTLLNTPGTWFLDPPYQKVPASYRRDLDCNTIDFQHLAHWARERQGQVIVCEQAGADWLEFREFRDLKAGTAGTRKGHEGRVDKGVIWTNDQRPSF